MNKIPLRFEISTQTISIFPLPGSDGLHLSEAGSQEYSFISKVKFYLCMHSFKLMIPAAPSVFHRDYDASRVFLLQLSYLHNTFVKIHISYC